MYCTIYTDIHVVWHLMVPPEAIGSQGFRRAAGGKGPRLVEPRVSPAWVNTTAETEAVPERECLLVAAGATSCAGLWALNSSAADPPTEANRA